MDGYGVGQLVLGEPCGGEFCVFVRDLDAEKVVLGPSEGGVLEEEAFAAADFDFERGGCCEELGRIPGVGQGVDAIVVLRQFEGWVKFG